MTDPRILVLSASAGTGHTRAAEALRSCAGAKQFDIAATHLDTLQFVTPLLRFLYTDAYLFLVRHVPGCGVGSIAPPTMRSAMGSGTECVAGQSG